MIVRLEIDHSKITFGEIATTIGKSGGDIIALDVIRAGKSKTIRDITFKVQDALVTQTIVEALGKLGGVKVVNISDKTFLMHLGGKIEIAPKVPIKNRDDLSHVYTPGVAKICSAIYEQPSRAFSLTIKRNTIAVVSDGTAVLGLGNLGGLGAIPVMEGKALLFKQLADVDAFPICLDTQDTEEIIRTIKNIAPVFGGINLEDIAAPRCFEIERRLSEELDIPVFHDDQHGTAVVILAGLINSMKIVGKKLEDCKVVICGVGAAGVACTQLLVAAGVRNVIGVDVNGAITSTERYDNEVWNEYASYTNPNKETGSLSEVIKGADIFIGVSRANLLKVEDVKQMAPDAIVFAMANPMPEIDPEEAEPYVRIMATGRSDYPNQINNVLCFPGIFRGVLDCRATRITEQMKLAAAHAIASVVKEHELNEQYIVPTVFNSEVVEKVKHAVTQAAYDSGVARKEHNVME
ncbi:NAD-dependent malic enzyme [Paenibacillus sediminis]